MPLKNAVPTRLDKWLEVALMLVLPMLLFLTTGIGAYASSKHWEFSVAAGFFGLLLGGIISVVIKLLTKIEIFTLPRYVFLIAYVVYMAFFYLVMQALPLLLPLVGMLAARCWARRCRVLGKPASILPFEQFRVSLFTATITGLFTLSSFLVILLDIPSIGWLGYFDALLSPLQTHVIILLMITTSAFLAYIQYILSRASFKF